jgi:hydroxymethylpyrimidine/phosphomethylpyrimidine kinase
MRTAARRILELGPGVVLVKGGHLAGDESIDVAADESGLFEFRGPRLATLQTHGTGCTLASGIAANLALGYEVRDAIGRARVYLEGAIRNAPGIGHGQGPLSHFWRGVY